MKRALVFMGALAGLASASCRNDMRAPGAAGEKAGLPAASAPSAIIGRGVAGDFYRVGGGLRATLDRRGTEKAAVTLPMRANDAVTIEDEKSRVALSFSLRGATASPVEISDGLAFYRRALQGSDVIHRVTPDGTEDFVVLQTRPEREELIYDVDVSHVAGLRLVGSSLEFLDAAGAPRLRVAPPSVADAAGQVHAAALSVDGCAYDITPAAPWGRPVTPPGAGTCSVRVRWASLAYPAVVDPSWIATGSMAVARYSHTATVLSSGQVLVAGGENTSGTEATAELYDPATGMFAMTGSLVTARGYHVASLLSSSKVLVAGGFAPGAVPLSSAEIYDPATGTFSGTGSLTTARAEATASPLLSGKVLVAGGKNGSSVAIAPAEIYDPTQGAFAPAGTMIAGRYGHTATVLSSGKVLLAGGGGKFVYNATSAEIYDPSTGMFNTTGAMNALRLSHTASLLPSGKVLIAGGSFGFPLSSAEIFDPVAVSFSLTGSMTTARESHAACTLISGKVLLLGGNSASAVLSSAELYDPAAGAFVATASMIGARSSHTASLLASGKVLAAGGGSSIVPSAELLDLSPNGGSCVTPDDCVSGVCDDGVCCSGPCNGSCQTCTAGTGACVAVTGGPDPDTCSGKQSCDATGTCKLVVGQPCPGGDLDCANGQCADGYCCDTSCSGACDVCSAQLGAPADGTCGPAAAGYAGSPACGGGAACDGTDVTCPSSSCASDIDCLGTDYCSAAGACVARKTQGSSCNVAAGADCKTAGCRECVTGHCADGFCCDTACNGFCSACAAALQQSAGEGGAPLDGTCGFAKEHTNPHGDACTIDPPATCRQDGMCDGMGGCSLSYPAGTACRAASCVDGVQTSPASCDAKGDCPAVATTACAPYACDVATPTCKKTCATSADCAPGSKCDASIGKCASASVCSGDNLSVISPGEAAISCGAFVCSAGACLKSCATVSDCAAPDVCDPSGACVPPPNNEVGASCSAARSVGAASSSAWALLVLALPIACCARRRRRSLEESNRRRQV